MVNDYIIVMDKFGGAHLEHREHKYTKREWQGKGWRYWYGDQYKKDAEDARRRANAKQNYLDNTIRPFINSAGGPKNTYLYWSGKDGQEKRIKGINVGGLADRYRKEIAEEARTAYNSQKLYEKSLAGRVEKGKKIIDSLLSKLKKKVNETAISAGKKLGLKTQQVETRTDISTGQKWKRVNGGPWEKVK